MRTSRFLSLTLTALLAALGVAACDSATEEKVDKAADAQVNVAADAEVEGKAEVKGEAAAAGDVEIKADALDLDGAVTLIKSGKVKDARALEKTINDPKKKLAKIDIDGDGTIDFVQVVEVRDGDDVTFELRVIPSSKKDAEYAVTVATIVVHADRDASKVTVRATYTAVVEHHDVYVYEYATPCTFEGDVVVVVDAPFFGWVYAPHDVYVGVYVHDEWIAVPGVVVVVDVDINGGCWPPGHCKHGKFKHHKFKGHKGRKGKW